MVGAIVLVRAHGPDDGPSFRTVLYASTAKYDLMDELQRLAHRIFMLGEGELVEAEARGAER